MTGALKSSVVCMSASQSTDYPGPDHSASPILIICDKLCHSCFSSPPGDAAHQRYHYSRAIAERILFHPVGRTLTVFSTFQLWIYIRTQTTSLVARGFHLCLALRAKVQVSFQTARTVFTAKKGTVAYTQAKGFQMFKGILVF